MKRNFTLLLFVLGIFLLSGCMSTSFSGDYVLGTGQTLRGNLYATSGTVTLQEGSRVTGMVVLTSGELFMGENSEVGRDVVLTSGALHMADGAVVHGDVVLSSQDIDVNQAPGAQVEGVITYNIVPFAVSFATRTILLYCVLPIVLLVVVILLLGLWLGRASRKQPQPQAAALPSAAAGPAPAAGTTTVSPTPAAALETNADNQQKLQQLKSMLDQGLITEADYEAKKAEILARM